MRPDLWLPKAICGLVAVFLSFPAFAEVIKCHITDTNRELRTRIGETLIIDYDARSGRAQFRDDVNQDRIFGDLARESDTIISFVWVLPAANTYGSLDPQKVPLRLSIRKRNGKALLTGSQNAGSSMVISFSGRANCLISRADQ